MSSQLKVSNINVKVFHPGKKNKKDLISNGSFVTQLPPVDKGFEIEMSFDWKLEGDASSRKGGDFFEYPVFNKDYISIMGDHQRELIIDGVKWGEESIVNGIYKIVFTDIGAKKDNLRGKFRFDLTFSEVGIKVDLGFPLKAGAAQNLYTINPINTTPLPINNPGHTKLPDSAKVFRKTSPSYVADSKELRWDIHIGSENLVDLMKGNQITKKEKFLVEDKINKNMKFKEDSVEVKSYLYVPFKDDRTELSGHTPSDVTIQVTKIEPNEGETYDEFRQRVQNATTPSYGVWQKSPDESDIFTGQVFLFAWGDLPGTLKKDTGEPLTYYSMYKKPLDSDNGKISMEAAIDRIANSMNPDRVITAEQAAKMKLVYGDGNGVQGQIVAARISFKVELVGVLDKKYENTASAVWLGQIGEVKASINNTISTSISGDDPGLDLEVKKEWKDSKGDPLDETEQSDSIKVSLLRKLEGTGSFVEAGKELLLKKASGWKDKFKNLDIYFMGQKIEYSVKEADVDDAVYTSEVSGSSQDGFVITNTKREPKVSIAVRKVWKNSDGSAMDKAIQPSEIKVKLTKKNAMTGKFEEVAGQEISLRRADDWEGKFENLPQKEATGEIIEYGVKEEVPEGYNTDVKKGDASGKFIITNTKKPKSTSGHKKPKPEPPKPDVEKPEVTPPAEPSEPPVAPPTTPPVAPSEPPAAPTEVPRYPTRSIPDPNDSASPEVIEVIGDDGVPLGTYKKVQRPDGTFEYIDEEGIPLGNMKLVGTGNDFPEMGLIAVAGLSILGMALIFVGRRRKTQ